MHTLKSYLKSEGRRMTHFAEAIGVSKGHMSEIVNGSRTPSLDVALRIARETGGAVDIETLVASSKRGPAPAPDQEAAGQ